MNKVESSSKVIFCPPRQGKPDPKEARPLDGPDTRRRVIQLGSKCNTCWDAVFNWLRDRYRAPNTDNLSERRFEKAASARRKAVTKHELSLPDLSDQLNDGAVQRRLMSFTKQAVQEPGPLAIIQHLDSFPQTVKLSTVLPDFQKQAKSDNLYDYLVDLKFNRRAEINKGFFAQIGKDPKDLFAAIKRMDPKRYVHPNWDALSPTDQRHFLDIFARMESARAYGLVVSDWHPKQPFESLVQELDKHGPLSVGGAFGRPHYIFPAKPLKRQIEGRQLYGWNKDDPKREGIVTVHQILIVGAEKTEKQQLVYYIDPMDDSDPAHPEKQRIYAMSYEKLTSPENIFDNHGFRGHDAVAAVGYGMRRGDIKKVEEKRAENDRIQEEMTPLEKLEMQREIIDEIGLKSILVDPPVLEWSDVVIRSERLQEISETSRFRIGFSNQKV
jgi:hypothetical protein